MSNSTENDSQSPDGGHSAENHKLSILLSDFFSFFRYIIESESSGSDEEDNSNMGLFASQEDMTGSVDIKKDSYESSYNQDGNRDPIREFPTEEEEEEEEMLSLDFIPLKSENDDILFQGQVEDGQ